MLLLLFVRDVLNPAQNFGTLYQQLFRRGITWLGWYAPTIAIPGHHVFVFFVFFRAVDFAVLTLTRTFPVIAEMGHLRARWQNHDVAARRGLVKKMTPQLI